MDQKKLLISDRVEVRQFDKGLRGSWHPALVIEVTHLSRTVKYDQLLNESGRGKLIESVPVTEAIEGLHRRRHVSPTYRGRIRPLPSFSDPRPTDSKLRFGVCVDAFYQDAWWEGVIFDAEEDATERSVYFPDEGDELIFSVDDLRLSRVWDEFSGEWTDCGVWVFLELVRELDGSMPSSRYAKGLWRTLQSDYGFKKMISEWKCGTRSLWKKYLKDVVSERESKLVKKDAGREKLLVRNTSKERHKLEKPQQAEAGFQSSGPAVQLRSSKGRSTVELTKNGGVSILNKSRARMVSVPLRLNVRKPNRPVVPTAGDKIVLSETLSMEENVSSYVSSSQTDAVSDEEYSTIKPTSCSLSSREKCVSVPVRKGEFGKVKQTDDKLKRPKGCQDGNKLKDGQTREDMVVLDGTCAEINQSDGRARVKKLKQDRKNCDFLSSADKPKELSPEASAVVDSKRKSSCTRGKSQKGISRADPSVESPLMKENGNGVHVEQNSFSRKRRRTPLFEGYEKIDKLKDMVSRPRKKKRKRQLDGAQSDTICFVCHYGGELISCNNCLSSYHLACLGSQVVPNENWSCTSCCCALCGSRNSINENEEWTEICIQCSRRYHVDCLNKVGRGNSNFPMKGFCSDTCYQLSLHLHRLLGTSNPTCVDGLTWTMIRSTRTDYRTCGFTRKANLVKISQALKVIHESFQPITELHTKRDMVKDVVYSYMSKLRRLDFQGFYVMVLLKGNEVVSAATIRIHGQKVAEMPLVATNFDYRQQGMCRLLVCELIKLLAQMGIERFVLPAASHWSHCPLQLLAQMGIERFVLPAASQLKTMWETSFGFSEMPLSDRLELLGYPLLGFQGTTMIQKFLDSSCRNAMRDPVFTPEDIQRSKPFVPVMPIGEPFEIERFRGFHYQRRLRKGSFKEPSIAEAYEKNLHPIQHVYKHKIGSESFGGKTKAKLHSEILHPFPYFYKRRRC